MEKYIYNQGQVGIIHKWLCMHKVYFIRTDDCIHLCRRNSLPFCMTTSNAIDGVDPAKCTKVGYELMTSNSPDCHASEGERTSLSLVFSSPVFPQKSAAELDLSTEVATRLKLVDQETPAFVPPEPHCFDTVHQRYSGEDIPRLTKVRLTVVSQIKHG